MVNLSNCFQKYLEFVDSSRILNCLGTVLFCYFADTKPEAVKCDSFKLTIGMKLFKFIICHYLQTSEGTNIIWQFLNDVVANIQDLELT